MNQAVTFGVIAAVSWGLAPTFSKRAYDSSAKPITAAAAQTVIGVILIWPATLVVNGLKPVQLASLTGVWPFILAGVTGAVIGRYLLYWSIDNIGASITSAVASTDSAFAVLIAIIALAESSTTVQLAGVLFTMGGVIIVSLSSGGNRAGWETRLILIPLIAAILYAVTAVLRRYGFGLGDTPVLLAVAISETTALAIISCFVATQFREFFRGVTQNEYVYLTASALSYTTGAVALFASLDSGPVIIGVTLASTSTLVNVSVARVFLQDQERVPRQTIIGVIISVFGVILVST